MTSIRTEPVGAPAHPIVGAGVAAAGAARVRTGPPATGAWQEGDPAGHRTFVDVGPLDLELGGRLPGVTVAYETWGTLDADGGNAVLVLHALTGDSHVVGTAGPGHPTAGWWDGLIGPGAPLDTRRCFVVAPNVLGGCQGTTGPSSRGPDGHRYGGAFPRVTVADQVEVETAARRPARRRPVGRGRRRFDGRHACARVGRRAPRPRRGGASSSPSAPRRPGNRSARRARRCSRSPPTRPGRTATTTTPVPAAAPGAAWASPAGSRI